MYNHKQQKLQWTIGPVTPYGWIDHRYMNDMNWVIDGIIWIGVFGEMEELVG